MIEVKKYHIIYEDMWNDFVLKSKNSHFMFCRNYMDYHSDKFIDNSLMFFYNDKLVALMPANISESTLYSHQGLTFGGIISDYSMNTIIMMSLFDALLEYVKNSNIKKIIYKQIPYIYYNIPSEEDQYVLYNRGAKLIRVDVSSVINMSNRIDFSSRRKRAIKKAQLNNLKVVKSLDYKSFYDVLTKVLTIRHNIKPTHTLEEIILLSSRFPENIKLYTTLNLEGDMLAGVWVFEMNDWVHTQYIVVSEDGKNIGALDYLFSELINNIYVDKRFFDFGISTENSGKLLNQGLITQKEEFGARAIVHQFFELNI